MENINAVDLMKMQRAFQANNFLELIKIANISWSVVSIKNFSLQSVYGADNQFCEEVKAIENLVCSNEKDRSRFCNLVVEYLSGIAIRSLIVRTSFKNIGI